MLLMIKTNTAQLYQQKIEPNNFIPQVKDLK